MGNYSGTERCESYEAKRGAGGGVECFVCQLGGLKSALAAR